MRSTARASTMRALECAEGDALASRTCSQRIKRFSHMLSDIVNGQALSMLNRRSKQRANIALPVTASFASSGEWPCIALNLSAAGACVAFAPGTHIPQFFELRLDGKLKLESVRVVWRRGHTVGVGFLKERAAPEVYPG